MDEALPVAHGDQDSVLTWQAWDELKRTDFKDIQSRIVRSWNEKTENSVQLIRKTLESDEKLMEETEAGTDWIATVDAILSYHEADR